MGLIPGGAYRNRKHVSDILEAEEGLDEMWLDLLCDPQTSGGLLLAVPENEAKAILEELARFGTGTKASVVGRVIKSGCDGRIMLKE